MAVSNGTFCYPVHRLPSALFHSPSLPLQVHFLQLQLSKQETIFNFAILNTVEILRSFYSNEKQRERTQLDASNPPSCWASIERILHFSN